MTNNFNLDSHSIYPAHNKVITHEKVTILEPKIIQVLCLLVQKKGEVLSRQDIVDSLWPDSVVGLEVVTRAIFELRKVLNDSPKQPKYIETIARKGYCFIGIIEPVIDTQNNNSSFSLLSKPLYRSALTVAIVLCTFALTLLYISPNTYFKKLKSTSSKSMDYQATILSDGIGDIQSASLSPDWSKILYTLIDSNSSESSLILKDTTSHKYSILHKGSKRFLSVIWAVEEDAGYFVQCNSYGCEIIKFSTKSEKLQQIYKTKKKIKSIKLASDNRIAITTLSNYRLSISMLKLESNKIVPLELNKEASNYAVSFNEAGNELFYVQQHSSQSTIKRHDLAIQKSFTVSTKFSKITSLHLEDDSSLIVAGRMDNFYSIWRLNLKTSEVEQVLSIPPSTHAYDVMINEKSQQLFYLKKSSNIDIAAIGLPESINPKLINSHANDLNAVWSQNERTIYFVSQRTGSYELWSHRNSTNNKLTTLLADSIRRPILNQKQNRLAFIAIKNNQLKLIIYDIEKEEITFSLNLSQQSYLLSWSHENTHIYMSIPSKNTYDIWQLDVTNSELTKVALSAGLIAKEQENGEFFFGDLRGQQLMVKNTNGSTSIVKSFKGIALESRPHNIRLNYRADSLYYVVRNSAEVKVMLASINDSTTDKDKEVFDLYLADYVTDIGDYDVGNPESNYVLYDHLNSKTSELILLKASN